MADIFISYSRRNLDFVQNLAKRLTEKGKSPWFDQIKQPLEGIPPGSKWWEEITYGIENADTFLFITSPQSISSPYCHAEIAHARLHSKRIVPVLYCGEQGEADTRRAIDAAIDAIHDDTELPDSVTGTILNLKTLVRENWLALSEIQYVVFSDSIPLAQSLEQLIQALDLDLAWVKLHSQLRQAAQLWLSNNRSDAYIWSAERLKPVYNMIEDRKPELSEIELDFIEPEQERLYREINDLQTTHLRRYDIGERLARIGDTRFGIGLDGSGIPTLNWLPVEPGGEIEIEYSERSKSLKQRFTIRPFFIAKYLITHRQFKAFVDSGEYDDLRWWQGLQTAYQRQAIRIVTNANANAPRDSVSWYQSVAFARWLNHHLNGLQLHHLSGNEVFIVGENAQIRLPTEWEWQWAAQNGAERRSYPWGDWDSYPRANFTNAGIGNRSTAVGMYPQGAAECGALDMAGNLAEWCLNDFKPIAQVNIINNYEYKVLRGGSWGSSQSGGFCWFRALGQPQTNLANYGLRLVVCIPYPALKSDL